MHNAIAITVLISDCQSDGAVERKSSCSVLASLSESNAPRNVQDVRYVVSAVTQATTVNCPLCKRLADPEALNVVVCEDVLHGRELILKRCAALRGSVYEVGKGKKVVYDGIIRIDP
jgi:hypothetical protein